MYSFSPIYIQAANEDDMMRRIEESRKAFIILYPIILPHRRKVETWQSIYVWKKKLVKSKEDSHGFRYKKETGCFLARL